MRTLGALLLVLACLHLSAAIVRYDTVSIQGLQPNGVIALLDGDDAYLGLGNRPAGSSLASACSGAPDGTIVVINSGGSLSNLPQLAICWNNVAQPFGGPANVNPDYVLSQVDSCPTGYHLAEIFDAAGYFHSDKPVIETCDADTFICPNRVRVKGDSGPGLQDCTTGTCSAASYTRPEFITAYLTVGGTIEQSNINAIKFDTVATNDQFLCVSNKAKLQFIPIAGLTAPPSAAQIATACGSLTPALTPASTAALHKHLHSGFDTQEAMSVFYERAVEYTSAYQIIEDSCFPLPAATGALKDVGAFYAPILYIATADSCPHVTNIPTITRTTLGSRLTSAPLITNDRLWNNLNPFTPTTTSKINVTCSDVSSGVNPPWPGLSHIILQGEGPAFTAWTLGSLTGLVNRDNFYSGAFAACLYQPDFVAEPVPIKCASGSLPIQVECIFADRTCVNCCSCTSFCSGCPGTLSGCTGCGATCGACGDNLPTSDCMRVAQ